MRAGCLLVLLCGLCSGRLLPASPGRWVRGGASTPLPSRHSPLGFLLLRGWNETEARAALDKFPDQPSEAHEWLASSEEARVLKGKQDALAVLKGQGYEGDVAEEALRDACGNATLAAAEIRRQSAEAVSNLVAGGMDEEEAKQRVAQRVSGASPGNDASAPDGSPQGMPVANEADVYYNVTEEGFQKDVLDASANTAVLVDVFADWCQPCKALAPVLHQVATNAGGALKVAKLDADKYPGLCEALAVTGLPTVFTFKQGRIVDSFVGIPPQEKLQQFLMRSVMDVPRPELNETELQYGHTSEQLEALTQKIRLAAGLATVGFARREGLEVDTEELLDQLEKDLPEETVVTVTTALSRYLSNLQQDPHNPRFRNVSMVNKYFQTHIEPYAPARKILEKVGFREKGNCLVVRHRNVAPFFIVNKKIADWTSPGAVRQRKRSKLEAHLAAAAAGGKTAAVASGPREAVTKKLPAPSPSPVKPKTAPKTSYELSIRLQSASKLPKGWPSRLSHTFPRDAPLQSVVAWVVEQLPSSLVAANARFTISAPGTDLHVPPEDSRSLALSLHAAGLAPRSALILAVQGTDSSKRETAGKSSSDPFSKRKPNRDVAGKVHTLLSQGILSGSSGKGNEYFGGDSTVFEAAVDEEDDSDGESAETARLSFSGEDLEEEEDDDDDDDEDDDDEDDDDDDDEEEEEEDDDE